ncbi:NACHT, LRR and PYD domains-containing protein 3 [Chanos chanos]|uniref:NACHT, LRR and PYD domains-containing protein 3 n=1 Tax=Chanos chanos TaxID=29144 RepID=A0A6J2UUS1_CHACN|nr:NACHT, LRR and PYD domains-containing protein 3-like [Chanos chanos]
MSKQSPPQESKERGSVCERCYLGERDGAACRPRITEHLQRATKEGSDPPTPTCDSVKSDDSMFQGINFSLGQPTGAERSQKKRPESPTPTYVSIKSEDSMFQGINFSHQSPTNTERYIQERSESPTPTCASMKSDDSMFQGIDFSVERHASAKSESSVHREDLFRCEKCKKKLKDLASIPSGHRYCRQCICKWDLSELIQIQHAEFSPANPDQCYTGPGDVVCDFCIVGKLRAVKSCLTCPASLCENHVRQHYTIPALQRHTLVEVTGDLEQRLCQQHHRALEVFCKTDQTDICKVCAVEEHKGHSKFYRESCVLDTASFLKLTVENNKEDFGIFQRKLREDYSECFGSELEDLDVFVEKMLESFGGEGALRIMFHLLGIAFGRHVTEVNKLNLIKRFQHISEGISTQGKLIFLNEIYTGLYITEGGGTEVNNEHEFRQIEMTSKTQSTQETPINCYDIFKTLPGQRKQIRTVLTKGVAGIGKTVSVQKFILDWAEGKANQDIMVIVPLPFRDLNLKTENYSLNQLLHHYAPELKELKDIEDNKIQLLFIFDGLDECRFPLDFKNNELCGDMTKSTSVDVLLTNLIKGHLLPSALLWITSRPAAVNQIPPECIDRVTEIRGFNDPQKEEYFRKRISDHSLADKIITHIKSSRSLYITCHIPVFCWLSATVLENMMSIKNTSEIPRTLTEMYTHFLHIQISLKNRKYHGATVENSKKLSQSDKEMILKLGELAFLQLEKGNLIFYEKDLRDCGIDVSKASEYSSVCTEIFREELGLYREKNFCFVHLSVQEHLAAVYAHVSFVTKNKNVFGKEKITNETSKLVLSDLHQTAISKTLQSKNGHLDLFLRFLLGLSLDSKQTILQDLMTGCYPEMKISCTAETVKYIKMKIREESPDRIISLFHCLNELNDNSLVEEIQTSFKLGTFSVKELEPYQCSALAYMLLMSEEVLDQFDLKMYKTSPTGQQRLLQVVKNCRKARLDHCNLSSESCVTVASALQSVNSPVRELDISINNLKDPGVKIISGGLKSANCKLQKLRLRKCNLTETCCVNLASVLKSPHSNLRELELRENDLQDSGVKLLFAGLEDPHCKLHTLQLAGCNLTSESCITVASALQSMNSPLRELDLSNNNLTDSGIKQLCSGLISPKCELLKLGGCKLSSESCVSMASVLQSVNSPLRKLYLSCNNLTDSGVKLLCAGLMNLHCKLRKLRLARCNLSSESCLTVASVLKSVNSPIVELDLSYNNLTDAGVKLLCIGLLHPHNSLEKLVLSACCVTKDCCIDLASVLKSPHSKLRELELRDNDLHDSGVKLLCSGLGDPHCKLHTLGLSGCLITEEGCASLALVLRSNPSHLRELDVSYNNPGDSGMKKLFALLEDPHCELEKLELDHGGEYRINPGLKKYACQLTLDPNTAHRNLSLSEGNRTVTGTLSPQPYPDHPERFKVCVQALCREALTERCYWEVEWNGTIYGFIGVTYKHISKDEAFFGMDNKSFSLFCEKDEFSFWHDCHRTAKVSTPNSSSRIGVYLDWAAGTLSFYSILNGTLTLLYTFHTAFTEPLYAALMVYRDYSMSLCQTE